MIKQYIVLLAVLTPIGLYAQNGCTDTTATNYDSTARVNNGSCIYPYTHAVPVFRAAFASDIPESSGLVYTGGKLWTHNDSGNPNQIFSVDTTTGKTLQTVYVDNAPNIDWEDITADDNYIYIGDHGNNDGNRRDLRVLRVAKSGITNAPVVHINVDTIAFYYTDQTSYTATGSTNFDCEALMAKDDSLYLFTKDRRDHQTRVYKMPKVPGSYALTPYTSYNINGLITGADYNLVTKEVVLIGYLGGHANSFLWILNGFEGDMFFSGNKRRIEIGNGQNWQTEGVTYDGNGRIFISCEKSDAIAASLYTLNEQWHPAPEAASNVKANNSMYIFPNPARETITVDLKCSTIQNDLHMHLYDSNGKSLNTWHIPSGAIYHATIPVSSLPAGNYLIKIKGSNIHLSESFTVVH